MGRFQHFILTRFNVTFGGLDRGLEPAWLERRLQIFDEFCFPSVRGQSCQDFRWLLFCHPATPTAYRDRILAYADWKNVIPVFSGTVPCTAQEIARYLDVDRTHLITTRLDNDDAISRDFIRTVQDNFVGQGCEFLNFPRGYQWHDGRIYCVEHPSNPFVSLIERVEGFETVWVKQHACVGEAGPVRQLCRDRSWLQVVHGGNIANRVTGTRYSLKRFLADERFDLVLPRVPPNENGLEVLLDRALHPVLSKSGIVRRGIDKLRRLFT